MKRIFIDPDGAQEDEEETEDEEREEQVEDAKNSLLVSRIQSKFSYRLEDRAKTLHCSKCSEAVDVNELRYSCSECDLECILCIYCYSILGNRHLHEGNSFWFSEQTQRWTTKSSLSQKARHVSCRSFLSQALRTYQSRPFLGQNVDNHWKWMTFHDVERETFFLKSSLLNYFGLFPGQQVILLCENSIEWVIVDFACISSILTLIPISSCASYETISSILLSTTATIIFVSDNCLQKLLTSISNTTKSPKSSPLTIKNIVLIPFSNSSISSTCETENQLKPIKMHTWEETLNFGMDLTPAGCTINLDDGRMASKETIVTINFTSGSGGGEPKGVIFTDSDWIQQMVFPITLKNIVLFGYMPLSHLAGRVDLYTALSNGGRIAFPSFTTQQINHSSANFFREIQEIRPTAFGPVPRICNAVKEMYEFELQKLRSQDPNGDISKQKKAIRKRLRNVFGNRLSSIKITSAPSTLKMRNFMRKIFKIAVSHGYGSTEAGSISLNGRPTTMIMLESVPELAYSVEDNPPRGQIYVKKESLRCCSFLNSNGITSLPPEWFPTGDIGEYRNGRLHVIDRKDASVKLSGGEFVSLGRLESIFSEKKEIVQHALVYADSFKQSPVLLIVPASKNITRKQVELVIEEVVKAKKIAPHEIPCGIRVLSEESEVGWTSANGLVTELGKPIRKKLIERYRGIIDATYTAAALARETSKMGETNDWSKTFFELGGDSFSATRVFEELRSQRVQLPSFEEVLRIPLKDLRINSSTSSNPEISINEEISQFKQKFAPILQQASNFPAISKNEQSQQQQRIIKHVFITGTTGFLGYRLLHELLCLYPNAFFHCLCRNNTKLIKDKQIITVIGDLSKQHFGLNDKEFLDLCLIPFDLIVHVGSYVNHFLSYEDLKSTNVDSLLDIATISIFGGRFSPLHVITSSAVYQPSHLRENGYSTSKFVQDTLAVEAQKMASGTKWNVVIHRPALIGPDSETGYYNERDWLCRLLQTTIDLHAIPITGKENTLLNWIPVDYCAHVIGVCINLGNSSPRIIDISAANIGIEKLFGVVKNVTGVSCVTLEVWSKMVHDLISKTQGRHVSAPFSDAWRNGFPGIEANEISIAENHVKNRQQSLGITSSNAIIPFKQSTLESISITIKLILNK